MEIIENPQNLVKDSLIRNVIKIAVVVLLAVIAIKFLTFNLDQLGQRIRQNQILLYNLEHRAENQPKLEEQYKVVFPYLGKIQSALPSKDEILGFIDTAENNAKLNGLNASLSFQETGNSRTQKINVPGTTPLNLQIKISGANLDKLINFVSSFEKIIYFTNINSVDVGNERDISQNLEGTLKGQLFLKEETGEQK